MAIMGFRARKSGKRRESCRDCLISMGPKRKHKYLMGWKTGTFSNPTLLTFQSIEILTISIKLLKLACTQKKILTVVTKLMNSSLTKMTIYKFLVK